jgi:hypothetical protein
VNPLDWNGRPMPLDICRAYWIRRGDEIVCSRDGRQLEFGESEIEST